MGGTGGIFSVVQSASQPQYGAEASEVKCKVITVLNAKPDILTGYSGHILPVSCLPGYYVEEMSQTTYFAVCENSGDWHAYDCTSKNVDYKLCHL